jgi:uncharacterized membrane protein YedE/YeeE
MSDRSSPGTLVAAAATGIVFGIGLAVSRMIDPEKIKNFLDFAAIPSGGWDPSLAFVMVGGLIVAFVGLRLDRLMNMEAPLAAPAFIRQDRFEIDRPLVTGAAIFGLGWGLSGLCPGPAFADIGIIPEKVAIFVIAMLVGSWGAGQVLEWRARSPTGPSLGATAE